MIDTIFIYGMITTSFVIGGLCAASFASIAAFAAGHDWLGVFMLPAWVLLGFNALVAISRERERVRLDEASRWRHLMWWLVERPEKEGDLYRCHYCKGTWKIGEGDEHASGCWYLAWWHAHCESQNEWHRWLEGKR